MSRERVATCRPTRLGVTDLRGALPRPDAPRSRPPDPPDGWGAHLPQLIASGKVPTNPVDF